MSGELKLLVKWSGQEYEVDGVNENDNIETLKDAIFRKTGVRPERQKLLNLKFKGLFYVVISLPPSVLLRLFYILQLKVNRLLVSLFFFCNIVAKIIVFYQ